MTLNPSGFAISSPSSFATTVAAANTSISVCVYRLIPATLNISTTQNLRFGITPVSVGMTSSNPAVGTIVTSPRTIAGNTSCTAAGAAGFQFDPVGGRNERAGHGRDAGGFLHAEQPAEHYRDRESIVMVASAAGVERSRPADVVP
jgi:hypothetical protein